MLTLKLAPLAIGTATEIEAQKKTETPIHSQLNEWPL